MDTAAKRPHAKKRVRTPTQKQLIARRRRQERFLVAFRTAATLAGACQMTRVGRKTHYDWLKGDDLYARKFKVVNEAVIEDLEQEAHLRATTGVDKPIFYKGLQVATAKEKSDVLLMFLLKAKRPEVYRERYDVKAEHSGVLGTINEDIIENLSDEKLTKLKAAVDQVADLVGG